MFLETRLKDDTFIQIDAEASLGIDKGGAVYHSQADVLDNMLTLAAQVTSRLKELTTGEDAPDRMSVTFGIRVNGNSEVSMARQSDIAQFQVTAEWSK
ncbi:MAG: hypothetical protein ACI8RZ_004166 [Myxococcota bacterium]|jgi:hypothetical protein